MILADEPTSNLDSGTRQAVIDVFLEIKGAGTAVILTSHDARLTESADRIYELEAGRLKSSGGDSRPGQGRMSDPCVR